MSIESGSYGRRKDIMLCYPFEDRRILNKIRGQTSWNLPFLCQPKLDGVRCRAVWDGSELNLFSSEAILIESVPHIKLALHNLLATSEPIEFDGELYNHDLPLEEILSRTSRSVELHPDYTSIQYHIFDIVSDLPQLLRLSTLINSFVETQSLIDPLFVVPTWVAEDLDGISEFLNKFIEAGYEGIVVREPNSPYVRTRSTQILKFKPTKEDNYVIRGFSEEISIDGRPKGALGAFLVSAPDEQTCFGVGSGFTRSQRQDFWNRRQTLTGKRVRVSYQRMTQKGIPNAIFVELLE